MSKIYQQLKNKKIGLLGFGIEGRATFEYLKKIGISPIIFDQVKATDFSIKNPEIDQKKTKLFLGPDYLKHLDEAGIIFKTPGVPLLQPEIQKAIKIGVTFTSQIEFFFDQCPGTIIGVTGTKGKGTTSTLVYKILKTSGKEVFLGGNIGLPAISFLDKLTEKSLVVLELSSFQLQTLTKSPQIAVVLNITQDHLDYHKDVKEYRSAKKNIVKFQNKNNFAVINADYDISRQFAGKTPAKVCYFSKEEPTNGCYVDANDNIILNSGSGLIQIAKTSELLLRGRHNLENITAAAEAALLAGADINSIKKTLKSFKGLEHRLELVREVNGIKFYNDSFSTTPETAIAAIKSFSELIVLILGGSDKGSNYADLGKTIEEQPNVRAIIFIGEMAEKIAGSIGPKYKGERFFGFSQMGQIVTEAYNIVKSGDIVLLSPACASFDLFQNYKDRGKQFKEAVKKI